MIYYLVILIYLSFVPDFYLWPVESEASTNQLVKSKNFSIAQKIFIVFLFLISLISYLSPLVLSVFKLARNADSGINILAFSGISISIIGRLISIKSALILKDNYRHVLVSNSFFKWSRNPIVMGLHLTFIGMLLIFPGWFLFLGFLIYAVNIHYKILIEEKWLINKFGNSYVNYSKSTPRYIFL